ncbi:ShlB/FhaC/HecB family hemolysin secretion/activation protein [Yoonia sediminilitoris]|uniref:Hemolysin activation/secretion protein n=1 Tax=Yoonia sediminilitoris TaxID=1286148 RepID=A0A2T6KMA0_9RHOB|nr:ShlB/FhaC/HecB family hemolysin secretion/activation protein [Yoonia sediminilitoris]PUB17287.1 hemolysin activation/secretion protein [Yoonia sediminilitoris]RCW97582.1 hemolysin activation/secretion protein [Yoonia sediminilitoris]
MNTFASRSLPRTAAIAFILLGAGHATAQTASEVTPESFQPALQTLSGAIVFDGTPGTQAPEGAETIGITLSGVMIVGAISSLAEANTAFETRLTRGRVPVSELFEATAALEEAYANAGFVLTRVVLPQQTLRDGGVLRVEVVNGFVETVDAAAVPPAVRARLDTLVTPLVDRPGITLPELERQLLLAGDVSGVALSSALAAGQRQGGTILALDAQFRPVTSFVGIDNFASAALGKPTYNFGVELNSLLNQGETFYGRFSTSAENAFTDEPRYRVGALGTLFPVGTSGLTVNLEVTRSVTNPESDIADTDSSFDRESLRVAYPFIRSRQKNLSGQIAFDHQIDRQNIRAGGDTSPIYRDEINVVRIAANGSYRNSDAAVSEGGIMFSRGLDAFGASDGEGTPLSREGASPAFSKLTASFRHERSLGDSFSLSVAGRGQASFGDTLVAAEQFGPVGAGDLSTFDAGALRGDSGAVLRTELAYVTRTDVAGRGLAIAPYAFAGAGYVSLANPTAVEEETTNASSFGVGVDFLLQGESPFRADSVRIEFGRGSRDNGDDEDRISISGNLRF